MIRTQAGTYELIEENRNGWNPDMFKERYSDVLDKYDYIVGDWGYGQLRLRGFFDSSNRKAPFEYKIASLDEYLQEFCNFGCPYFVLKRTKKALGLEEQAMPFASGNGESPSSTALGGPESSERSERPPRQGGYQPRYNNNKRRYDKNDNNNKERPDKGERPERQNRYDKPPSRYPRSEPKDRTETNRPPRTEQPPRERRPGGGHNRPPRDKVPTGNNEFPRRLAPPGQATPPRVPPKNEP